MNVEREGAANLDVIQEVEYAESEAKVLLAGVPTEDSPVRHHIL